MAARKQVEIRTKTPSKWVKRDSTVSRVLQDKSVSSLFAGAPGESSTGLYTGPPKRSFFIVGRISTFIPFYNCVSLTAGCLIIAFIYLVMDCLVLFFAFLIFLIPYYYVLPYPFWSEDCSYNASIPLDPTDNARVRSTFFWKEHMIILVPFHLILIISDILLFLAVTEKHTLLLIISMYASAIRLAEQSVWVAGGMITCEKDIETLVLAVVLFVFVAYSTMALDSAILEVKQKQLMTSTPEPSQAPSQEHEDDEEDDTYMISTLLSHAQLSRPMPSKGGRRVSLQLKPDVFEVQRFASHHSLDSKDSKA